MASTPAAFRPWQRITSPADYRRILRRGVRLDGPLFTLVALENGRGRSRLGLTAGRRLGSAVVRNRAKRLVRESFRQERVAGSQDLVFVLKPDIVGRSQQEVAVECRERLRRLLARQARPARAAAPAAD